MHNKKYVILNLHKLNIILVLILIFIVFYYNDQLPDNIPTHFDISGNPDGWSGKVSIFVLLSVDIGLNLLFYAIIFLLPWFRKHPKFLNMPGSQKEKFLSLPEEKQKVYWDLVANYLTVVCILINFIWISVMWGTIQVALSNYNKLPFWSLWPGLILIIPLNIYYIRKLKKTQRYLIGE